MKLTLEKNQKLFFTSDTHYAHTNICRGVTSWKDAEDKTRDFKTLDAMNAAIVNNINETVGQDDILVHLGDFSFGGFDKIIEFRKRIVCKNIILVYGNHDHHIQRNKDGVQGYFMKTTQYLNLAVISNPGTLLTTENHFVCFHYPTASWENMNKGVYHLFGHVHLPGNKKLLGNRSMDVGMDGNNYTPYELHEVVRILKSQPVKSLLPYNDHHVTEVR